MKKYLSSYGVLFLYFIFAFGLDRAVAIIREIKYGADGFFFGMVYVAIGMFWPIFAAGTMIYFWYVFKKTPGDRSFNIFQIVIGVLGILLTLYFHLIPAINFPFYISSRPYTYLGGGLTGGLNMALVFTVGLGIMGLLRKNGNDETVS